MNIHVGKSYANDQMYSVDLIYSFNEFLLLNTQNMCFN